MSHSRALALVALVAGVATAQGATPSLHSAWMLEVLDLDTAAAAKAYAQLAADRQAPRLERLVATARRLELRHHGIEAMTLAIDDELVPEVLRPHFQQLPTSEPLFDREAEAGRGATADVAQFFAATEAPQLRPLVVASVLAAAEQENPQAAERQRQLRSRFLPWSHDPTRVLDRIRANEIVRAELDGRRADAADLRRREFPNWRTPALPPDAAATWSMVQRNLDEWLRERHLTAGESELLRRLQHELEQAAQGDPQSALQWLERMPLYSERLLQGRSR